MDGRNASTDWRCAGTRFLPALDSGELTQAMEVSRASLVAQCSLTTSFKQKTEVVLREPSELSPLPHGCQGVRLPFLPVLAGGSVFSPGKKDKVGYRKCFKRQNITI